MCLIRTIVYFYHSAETIPDEVALSVAMSARFLSRAICCLHVYHWMNCFFRLGCQELEHEEPVLHDHCWIVIMAETQKRRKYLRKWCANLVFWEPTVIFRNLQTHISFDVIRRVSVMVEHGMFMYCICEQGNMFIVNINSRMCLVIV